MSACQNLLVNAEMKARNSLSGRTLARAKQNGSPDKYLEVISRLWCHSSDWHRPKTAYASRSAVLLFVWSISYVERGMRIVKLFGLPPIEGTNDNNCGPYVVNSCMEGVILSWKESYSHGRESYSHLVVTCEFLRSGSVVNEMVIEPCEMDVFFISSVDDFYASVNRLSLIPITWILRGIAKCNMVHNLHLIERIASAAKQLLERHNRKFLRLVKVTGRFNREPAQLRDATKEPDNIHVKPDNTFEFLTKAEDMSSRGNNRGARMPLAPSHEMNSGARMLLAPSHEMNTSKCFQQCHWLARSYFPLEFGGHQAQP
ncbi:uncharacterized protein BJ212DRAFT_1296792 [Suillus subaureus]|uniref:Uncharacterized protein n=1 Tax=Suillus subaureus TaxID=48587 RepID=A0A9P7EIR1_9AGAM|nr:uncharacterized protein BJ212DRAFT_1296792 [Suillus subaureus]KAG1822844.1 hypothetical protein BJ212DRAFT_1296792 [Suillus subaureus]